MTDMSSTFQARPADTTAGSREPDLIRLAELIRAHTPHDGQFELRISGVHVSRASRTNTELVYTTARPCVCIIAQGAKSVLLGREMYAYDASRMLVFSVDLPVAGQVTKASLAEPYLSFRLDLDPHKIVELVLRVYPHGVPRVQESRGVYVAPVDFRIVNAATRLLELLAQPGEAELLGPLVIEGIADAQARRLPDPERSLVRRIHRWGGLHQKWCRIRLARSRPSNRPKGFELLG